MSSNREAVELMLRTYRENKSDYEITLNELTKLQKQLILAMQGETETKEEVIEGLCIHAPVLSDIPKSVTNKFSSATENAALNYMYYIQPSELEIKALKQLIIEKTKVLERHMNNILTVENLLICLTDQERFIVEHRFIKGFTRKQTLLLHNEQFTEMSIYDTDSIRRLQKVSLIKMAGRLK